MFWVSLLLTLLWTTSSWAQSNPGFISGATLCANTGCPGSTNPLGLNQAFMLKQDLLGGGTPIVGTTAFTGGSVVPFSTPVPPVSGVWLSGTTSPGILYTQAGYSGLQNYAQELVQYVTTQPNAIAEVGLVVDALFKTGYSATNTAATAYKAAMTLSSRVCGVGGVGICAGAPGTAHVWNLASDMIIDPSYGAAPNNTNNGAFNVEWDITNSGWDAFAGNSNGNIANVFVSGIIGNYPITSEIWVTSGENPISTYTGTISGTTLTMPSITSGFVSVGQAVTGAGVAVGTFITAGSGLSWTVNKSQTVGPVAMTGYSYASHYGLFLQNRFTVKDASILDSTNSQASYEDFGTHINGLDLSQATYGNFAISLSANQIISFGSGANSFSMLGGAGFLNFRFAGGQIATLDQNGDWLINGSLTASGTSTIGSLTKKGTVCISTTNVLYYSATVC